MKHREMYIDACKITNTPPIYINQNKEGNDRKKTHAKTEKNK